MNITKQAITGTLESSDIMITVGPGEGGIDIELDSSVDMYYHEQIMKEMNAVFSEMDVASVSVHAVDHGALDGTIRARMTTALKRAMKKD